MLPSSLRGRGGQSAGRSGHLCRRAITNGHITCLISGSTFSDALQSRSGRTYPACDADQGPTEESDDDEEVFALRLTLALISSAPSSSTSCTPHPGAGAEAEAAGSRRAKATAHKAVSGLYGRFGGSWSDSSADRAIPLFQIRSRKHSLAAWFDEAGFVSLALVASFFHARSPALLVRKLLEKPHRANK